MAHPLSSEGDAQPYTRLLYEAIERAGVEVEPLRTAAVVRRPPDVVHLHWPEHALQHRGVERYRRALLLVASVRLARRRGTVLVYTAHNAIPHDLDVSRFGRWFLESIDRQVDTVLILSEASREELARARPRLPRGRMVHTPHGHFRDAYPTPPPAEVARASFGIAPGRPTVAFVGQVRPYKGVTDLVEAVRPVDADLLVAGSCSSPSLCRELEAAASADPRVHLRLERLPATELAAAVGAATVVVLPYRRVLNSGSALLALSLGRAILVPDTPTFRELAAGVGGGWVRTYEGEQVAAEDLRAALVPPATEAPDLSRHEWSEVAARTIAAYESAIAARSGRRTPAPAGDRS